MAEQNDLKEFSKELLTTLILFRNDYTLNACDKFIVKRRIERAIEKGIITQEEIDEIIRVYNSRTQSD